MSEHKITVTRSGSHPTMGDWDAEYEITFRHSFGVPPTRVTPGHGDIIEFASISPGADDHGAFSDLAQRDLEDWASEWLATDGYEKAVQVVASDSKAEGPDEVGEQVRSEAEPVP